MTAKPELFLQLRNRVQHKNARVFTLTPLVVALMTSANLFLTGSAVAADARSADEIQAEIIQLEAALEKNKQELAAKKATTAPAAVTKPTVLGAVQVTGRRNELQTLKDVPQSVSVVTGVELTRLNATNISEVLNRVGNVNFNAGNPRTGSLTLRGITTGSSDQIDPSIGTVLDGVSLGYTPLANGYVFVDIDTVDVTRGPQGTQGGKPSNIGRITFTTKEPSFLPEAQFSQTFGEWNTLKSTAIAGGAIVDDILAWRGTFQREQGDGPWDNQFPDLAGRDSYKNLDRTFGRVQFLLTPSDTVKVKLSVEHQPKGAEFLNGLTIKHPEPTTFSNGAVRAEASVDTVYKKYQRVWFNRDSNLWNTERDYYREPVNLDNNGSIITSSKGATLNVNWLVASHELQSITGYRNHLFSAANDEGTPFDITKSGGYITDYSQVSQELRLVSDKDGWVDYVGGLYYLSTDNDSFGSRTRYGDDAGAYYASKAVYESLSATATGQALLRDSLNFAYKGPTALVKNESKAIYGEANWHLSEPLTLTTGYRITRETRETSQDNLILDEGVGADLTNARLSINNKKEYVAGNQVAADRLSLHYFNIPLWNNLPVTQRGLVYEAASVRNGTLQPGSVYARKTAEPWEGNLYTGNISLANKISDQLTVYGTAQYGEKGGIAQITSTGDTRLVDKERTTGYELGLRSTFLDNDLTLNADIFVNDIEDFQNTVGVPDPVATRSYQITNPGVSPADAQQYQSLVDNVPGVRVKGIEVDAIYSGIEYLSLRVATAYNDARYSEDVFLAQPLEVDTNAPGYKKFFNAKDDVLNNAAKFTYTLGVNYNLPVFTEKLFHVSANYKYTSQYKTSESIYNTQNAYGLLDLGIGIGRQDGLFDVNVILKNALDKNYHIEGWNSYTPSTPRWIGITFSTKI